MPEKPPAKSPPKSASKTPPKPLTSIPRPATTSGTPNPRGNKPSGAGTNRPPLANQHDRVRYVNGSDSAYFVNYKTYLENHENVITDKILRRMNWLTTTL